jgi:hypothetical protein
MLAPDFPSAGTGRDLLLAEGAVTIEKAGFFFVPPTDERFIGAGMFDRPRPRRGKGRLFVRKKLVDASGNRVPGQLDGAVFQVLVQESGLPEGPTFATKPDGHAISPELPVGVALVLREVTPLPGAPAVGDIAFQLEGPHQSLEVRNVQPAAQPSPYRP